MRQNLLESVLMSEALLRILLQQLGDEVPANLRHLVLLALSAGEYRRFLTDQLLHFLLVVLVNLPIFVDSLEKWHKSDHHLVGDDTESPPIDLIRVPLRKYGLRCHVIACTTDSFGNLVPIFLFEKSRQSKVGQAEVAVITYQQVHRLQIAMDDILLVQRTEGDRNLSSIEFDIILIKLADLSEQV